MINANVLKDINAERERQDAKWGEQNHGPMIWLPILMEEVGEAAQEAVKADFYRAATDRDRHLENYREELVQVAALAVAMLESFDRNEAVMIEEWGQNGEIAALVDGTSEESA